MDMSDDERQRLNVQVDHFIDLLAKRYGLSPSDVVDAVQWVKAKKEMSARIKMSGAFSIIGIVVGALLLALWEGFRAAVLSGGKP